MDFFAHEAEINWTTWNTKMDSIKSYLDGWLWEPFTPDYVAQYSRERFDLGISSATYYPSSKKVSVALNRTVRDLPIAVYLSTNMTGIESVDGGFMDYWRQADLNASDIRMVYMKVGKSDGTVHLGNIENVHIFHWGGSAHVVLIVVGISAGAGVILIAIYRRRKRMLKGVKYLTEKGES